jgi:hypothetical protein
MRRLGEMWRGRPLKQESDRSVRALRLHATISDTAAPPNAPPTAIAMTRPRTILLTLAATAVSNTGARFVRADERDPAAAEALFREGRKLLRARNFTAACEKLEESQRLDPATGTLVNLADCEEQLGRTATAWQHWRAAVDQLAMGDKRRAAAVSRAAALEKAMPRLTIALAPTAPADAAIQRDGTSLGQASLGVGLPIDPGRHVVTVSAKGREVREVEVVVRASEQRTLVVEPGPTLPAPIATTPTPPPAESVAAVPTVSPTRPPAATSRSRPTTLPGYLLLGGGAAGLGVGGYFALQAWAARRDAAASCPDVGDTRRCWVDARGALDRDKRASLYADIGLGVGVLSAAAGLYLLVTGREEAPVTAAVVPLAGGGKVQVDARF